MLLLKDIVDAGVDGIHSIQPTAGMDIGRIKHDFGDLLSLLGNIEISYPLTLGTVHETIEVTKRCIEVVGMCSVPATVSVKTLSSIII
jgi:uroporphyrinogen decarboxylase